MPSFLSLPPNLHFISLTTSFSPPNPNSLQTRSPRLGLRLSASLAQQSLDLSWFPPDPAANDNYGGWAHVDSPIHRKNQGLPTLVIRGIGASVAVAVAAIAYFTLSRKGFKFQITSPLHVLHGIISPADNTSNHRALDEDALVSETSPETKPITDSKSDASGSFDSFEETEDH
ncbi:hypothetical protein M0R45_021961 [Rubus argutus]|uniref:Uncharacterized protein n=1 Tax=Rubus argutus TaxID=59490 RepID=A0AAW1XGF6_RUBAR